MKKLIMTGAFLMALPSVVVANDAATEHERRLLISAAQEIENIKHLLDQAERASESDARIRLDYANLHADINEIQSALTRHAETPSRTPRKVNPLKKHYRR